MDVIQYNQKHWSFSRNGKSAEDLNELKYLEIDDNNLKAEVTGLISNFMFYVLRNSLVW